MSNFMQICSVGAELFHADGRTGGQADRQTDGQTDMHDLDNSLFRNFVNMPKHFLLYHLKA
jgi:hypothetical protein